MKKIIIFSLLCSFGVRAMNESPRKPLERLPARGPMFINHRYSFAEGSKTPHVYHAYQPDYVHLIKMCHEARQYDLRVALAKKTQYKKIADDAKSLLDNLKLEINNKNNSPMMISRAQATLSEFIKSCEDRTYSCTNKRAIAIFDSFKMLDSKNKIKKEVVQALQKAGLMPKQRATN
ncbi:MAG: hypothetical protein WC707_00485 [Candidatus Babeliaceae bacterium]|jgi:hypothetical protein